MNILAIESASTICGVALFLNNSLIELDEVNKPRIHGEKLPLAINNILIKYKLKIADLDGIAVSSGPGSYTGLRIGMSLAKGLAMAENIPIIPVPTLEVMNHSIIDSGSYYVLLYSHKDLVFTQYYENGRPSSLVTCEVFDKKKFNPRYGFNMDKIYNLSENELVSMSAKNVGELALENFKQWANSNLNEVIPNYITEFNLGKV